ncbi:MAG: DNA-directed RNA polymerase subunit L [Candidatus Aenigmarchaeota archaeon]|nr:DNA-directed RNA polymerase subunit L [Candidatus Aenigmarchaeota archaeon]
MKLEIESQETGKLEVLVKGEDHTLLNIIKENAWKKGADQASYIIKHPYMSDPKLIIRAKNPKKILTDAAQLAIDDSKEFETVFSREVKGKK